jgi:DNA helicase HerA-like ATPase
MSAPVNSERAFAMGVTGSGKTTLLRKLFVARAPRVIALDVTGEWEADPGFPHVARSLDGLLRALEHFATRKERRWHIAAQLSDEETQELAQLLVPETAPRSGLCQAYRGIAIAVDEADTFAPQSAPPAVRALWRRGRHAGLSIYAATQRPSAVHRDVTSQSRWLIVAQTHEGRDLAYLRQLLPAEPYRALERLPRYHAVLFDALYRRAFLLDERQEITRVFHPASAAHGAPAHPD